MAKPESSNPNERPSSKTPASPSNWIAAAACLLFGMLLSVAFLSYSPEQSHFVTTNPTDRNIVGDFGSAASFISFFSLGLAAWLIPFFLLWFCYLAIRSTRQLVTSRIIATLLCLPAAAGLAAMVDSFKSSSYFPHGPGGLIGHLIYKGVLEDLLGDFGAFFLLGIVYVSCLLFIFTKDIGSEIERIMGLVSAWWAGRAKRKAAPAPEAPRRAPAAAEREEQAPLVLEPIGPANKNVLVARTSGASLPRAEAKAAKPEPKEEPVKMLSERELERAIDERVQSRVSQFLSSQRHRGAREAYEPERERRAEPYERERRPESYEPGRGKDDDVDRAVEAEVARRIKRINASMKARS